MAEVEVSGLSLQQDGKILCSREKGRRGEVSCIGWMTFPEVEILAMAAADLPEIENRTS